MKNRYKHKLLTYNGYDHDARVAVIPIQNRLVKSGDLSRPESCSICGKPSNAVVAEGGDYIFLHLENYDAPEDVLPACRSCHASLHARFKNPARWVAVLRRHWRPGEWFTLLTMDPASQDTAYSDLYPHGLPKPGEIWDVEHWPDHARTLHAEIAVELGNETGRPNIQRTWPASAKEHAAMGVKGGA